MTQTRDKHPAAVALGRLGGQARAKNLTPEQRREAARKAGQAGGRGRPKHHVDMTDTTKTPDRSRP